MTRYKAIATAFYSSARTRLLSRLMPDSCVIVYGNSEIPWSGDQYYPFRQNADFFYLTGIDQEDCVLLLQPSHPNPALREQLFIKNVSEDKVIWYGEKLSPAEAKEISGIENVQFLESFSSALHEAMLTSNYVYLNWPETSRFICDLDTPEKSKIKALRESYPLHRYERLSPLMRDLRIVKEAEEIEQIQKSIQITAEAFEGVLKTVQAGMKEYEVEAEITRDFIRRGSNSHAYAPIIAGGKNACILHYNTNHCTLKDGDMLLMDFGASYGNYSADLSRTVPINGTFSPRQREVYNAVLDVFKKAKALMLPGTTIEKIQQEVVKIMSKKLVDLKLLTDEEAESGSLKYMKYYMHGIGHFMGIDVHDTGFRNTPLKKGMIITCEPGIYIQEEGIGIRIENDILISDQPIDLMAQIPIEIEDIEAAMKRS